MQRSVVNKEINHQDYVDVMESAVPYYTNVRGFQSKNHIISTMETNKRALSLFEDKRCWIEHNVSYAYGHWRLQETAPPPNKKLKFSIENLS